MTREWSGYQRAIFSWVKEASAKPRANLLVNAVAGSGKSTTIVEALKLIPDSMRVLFLAYNKHIAEELKRRVPENVEAATINSFGWRALRAARRGVKLDADKVKNVIRTVVADDSQRKAWGGAIQKLVDLKKANPDLGAEEIIQRYDVDAPTAEVSYQQFLELAGKVWVTQSKQKMLADFNDQYYVPSVAGFPIQQYDFVFVDETQDLSAAQAKLVSMIAPRVVAVGDPRQSIYLFRGADPESMPKMKKTLNMDELPLSVCYRCARNIVREAKEIVPHIEWSPTAAEGVVDHIRAKDFGAQVKPGDWTLCRSTAPLVSECLRLVVQGVKASVKGRDIGQQILQFVDKTNKGTDATSASEYAAALRDWASAESQRLAAAERDAQLQALEDKVEAVEALSEGARSVGDIKRRVETVFRDEASPGVNFATAHRAKGLEAQNIFVLRPDMMPMKRAVKKGGWQLEQEYNLRYVAITRAMNRLAWVAPDRGAK